MAVTGETSRPERGEHLLAAILSTSSDAILVTDADSRILLMSAGATAIFGYQAEELLGRTIDSLIPEAFRAGHAAKVAHFAAGDAASVRMDSRAEVFGLRKSGETFPAEASISKLDTPDGMTFTVILRDISARRAAEERLACSERRLSLAIENAGLHVYEVDYQRGLVLREGDDNAFFDRPLSYEALAEDIWAGIHPEDREMARRAWVRHRRTGAPFGIEIRTNRHDGRTAWAFNTAVMVEDEQGRPLRLVGALLDITDRKQAEGAIAAAMTRADAANLAKSQFLAAMSHEIRTPLNGVLGMAQVMAGGELTRVQRERLEVISRSGEALLVILNDILDLAKIEAGRLELECVDIDMGDLAHSALATFGPLADAKGIAFTLDLGGAAGVYRGDPTRLRQILHNLLSNALKFTEAGEVRLAAWRQGEILTLQVRDTGVGIPAEAVSRLFSAFEQGDVSTTRRFGGTGLGLAICRQLAGLMGGSIAVESEVGKGSAFTVTLPMPRLSDPPGGHPDGAPPPMAGPTAGLRVLVAEDNAINQLVIRTMLEQLGLEPVLVENGRRAVEAWDRGGFDLILMDVQMPEMDGCAATRAIRAQEAHAGRPRTPILALTANAMAHHIEEYLAAGMDSCVTKPISARELVEAIHAVAGAAGSA